MDCQGKIGFDGRVRIGLLIGLMALCCSQSMLHAQQVSAGQAADQRKKLDATTAPVTDKSKQPVRFTTEDRLRFYKQTTFSPFAFVGPITGAAVTQWTTGNPPQWGQGFAGYGKRLLSGYGRQVIANTIALGVGFTIKEDPRRRPTSEQGVWKRGLYAARGAFVSHAASGKLIPAYSRILGAYGAGFISNAWYPRPYSNVHSALYRGTTALASDIIWQEFKEFWPDVRGRFPRR
jgi:hypothetical protein